MTRTSLLLAALAALAPPAAAQATPAVVIQNATVVTRPGASLKDATVVIQNGRIARVGKNIKPPRGSLVIDGAGKTVTAGLIDSSTRLGLVEVDMVRDTVEGVHRSDPHASDEIHAAYRVVDGYNPASIAIPIARTGGVTTAVATPRGGLVAGTSALVQLGEETAPPFLREAAAMHATLGEGALGAGRGSRGRALENFRELFFDARDYQRSRARFNRNQTRRYTAGRLDLEAMAPVLTGRLPLVVQVNRAADIRALLRWKGTQPRVRLIIEGGVEAWKVADELARARVPVLVDPTGNLPGDFDKIHVRNDNAKRLADAGVVVAISTLGEWANVRNLRQLAGIAVAYGLSRDQALAAVTTNPAKIFGASEVGTLAPGKIANLVVWSGDPFELSTQVEHIIVGGRPASLRTRQTRLYERYKTLPKPPR